MARLLALFVGVGVTRPLRGDSLALALGAAIIQRLEFALIRRACCLDALRTAPLPALFQDIVEFLTGACNRLLHRARGVEDVDRGRKGRGQRTRNRSAFAHRHVLGSLLDKVYTIATGNQAGLV